MEDLHKWISTQYDESAIPSLADYIKIPNQSPKFDADWDSNGYEGEAARHIKAWVEAQEVQGLTIELLKDEGMTSLLYIEVEPTVEDKESAPNLFFYGHFDKQPHFTGW